MMSRLVVSVVDAQMILLPNEYNPNIRGGKTHNMMTKSWAMEAATAITVLAMR
jgi:hypothetical protein